MDINTCFETTNIYHTVAYYSHLVPVILALFLGFFGIFQTKFSKISVVFFSFVLGFSLWLLNDLILWTSNDYGLIVFFWSWIDYVDALFFILGAYFYSILLFKKVSSVQLISCIVMTLPILLFTLGGHTITEFDQTYCEAINNSYSVYAKILVEIFAIIWILISFFKNLKEKKENKIQGLVVMIAILLFFAIFSFTEYVAASSGIYEINLYSLFVLPVFLALIIYSITNLKMFQLRLLGTQLLVYVLLIMVGSQFFFLENTTNQVLTAITFILSISFGVILLRNVKKESEAREKIETLARQLQTVNTALSSANTRLKELDTQKTEFISFATHQLRSPLTAINGNVSLILEGDLGPVPQPIKEAVDVISASVKTQINIVEDYLNVSRIELGTMKYNFINMDLKDILSEVFEEQQTNINEKGLKSTITLDEHSAYPVKADPDKLKQVLMNLIDNSTKYTPSGSISVSLEKDPTKPVFRVKISDTGTGIAPQVMPKLFQKFSRAPNASEANIHGTGLGLYLAKEIVNAHGGRIWAESEGEGKGSQFYVELPEVN